MTYLPSVDIESQAAVRTGARCRECGHEFTEPNGFVALCPYCWRNTMPPKRLGARLSIHDEVAAAAGKVDSRKRRTHR